MAFGGVWAGSVDNEPGGSRTEQNEPPEEWPRIIEQEVLKTIIIATQVTVAHPKITQAPLLKRKLGSLKWDIIHDGIQGRKRDAASCPTDFQLCPESMKGGCCPNDRVCGTSSCFAKSAAPASACGRSGYIECGMNDGGGCCPSNYVCGRAGCTPKAGVVNTETCGVNSYLCPESLNFGCCRNGLGCGLNNCYSTELVTLTMTETVITTGRNSAQTLLNTIVTTISPDAPTAGFPSKQTGVLPKETAPVDAEIPKTKATGSSGGGGLTKSQLGGIIGGAVILLVMVLVIAFIVLKRLDSVKRFVEESSLKSSTASRSRQSHSLQKPSLTPEDIDAMSIDPLIMNASDVSRDSIRHPSHPSAVHSDGIHSSHHEVEASSPPIFTSPFSPRSPPYYNSGSGYAPVALSDTSSGYRDQSVYSAPNQLSHQGYFDITPNRDLRDQNMRFGRGVDRRPSIHQRQWSESSDQSGVSLISSTGIQELESGEDDRRSNFARGIGMVGRLLSRRQSSNPVKRTHTRNTSEPILTGGPVRGDFSMSPVGLGVSGTGAGVHGGLGHIDEAGESKADLGMQEVGSGRQFRDSMLMERQRFSRAGEGDVRKLPGEGEEVPDKAKRLLGLSELRNVDLGN